LCINASLYYRTNVDIAPAASAWLCCLWLAHRWDVDVVCDQKGEEECAYAGEVVERIGAVVCAHVDEHEAEEDCAHACFLRCVSKDDGRESLEILTR